MPASVVGSHRCVALQPAWPLDLERQSVVVLSVFANLPEDCVHSDDVSFYIKLPRWFEIDTPVGTYNPDWALSYKNSNTLYFVAETKGGSDSLGVQESLLRPLEQLKIECGKRHFKLFEQVQFRVVKRLDELVK